MKDVAPFMVKNIVAMLITAVIVFASVQAFVFTRTEADRMDKVFADKVVTVEKRVDRLEAKIDRDLTTILTILQKRRN